MADSADISDNVHILIFYLYLTKDRRLIERIQSNANKLFTSYEICNLIKDVEFLNRVPTQPLPVIAPSADTVKNQNEYREMKDTLAEGLEQIIVEKSAVANIETEDDNISPQNDNEDEGQLSEELIAKVREIRSALNSLQIMGQVLRNFPSDLRADLKLELASASYRLGFRVIRRILAELEGSFDRIQARIRQELESDEEASEMGESSVIEKVNSTIMTMVQVTIFGIFKRMSFCIGLEELKDVYQAIREESGEDHIPTRLLDLSIRLDHLGNIPINDVVDLEHRLRRNGLIYTILRLMIAEFLYLFPVDFKLRQKMVSLLQLSVPMTEEKKVKTFHATAGR